MHEWSGVWIGLNTTIDALLSETKLLQNLTGRKKMIRIYCSGQHWSDERQKFPIVTARKEKVWGHCFICLKQGHQLKNCTVKNIIKVVCFVKVVCFRFLFAFFALTVQKNAIVVYSVRRN